VFPTVFGIITIVFGCYLSSKQYRERDLQEPHAVKMATPEEQAVAFKNQGNKAFAAHDWPTAIDLYSKAIELNDKEPTYWSNRAQVCAPCSV
jgi:Flp pilus assembly protein TadD